MTQTPCVTVKKDEAGTWYVADSDVPGLVRSDVSLDRLVKRLDRIIPELLDMNDHLDFGPGYQIIVRS